MEIPLNVTITLDVEDVEYLHSIVRETIAKQLRLAVQVGIQPALEEVQAKLQERGNLLLQLALDKADGISDDEIFARLLNGEV